MCRLGLTWEYEYIQQQSRGYIFEWCENSCREHSFFLRDYVMKLHLQSAIVVYCARYSSLTSLHNVTPGQNISTTSKNNCLTVLHASFRAKTSSSSFGSSVCMIFPSLLLVLRTGCRWEKSYVYILSPYYFFLSCCWDWESL